MDKTPKLSHMEWIILTSLINKEIYGLQIEKAINEGSNGQFNITVGSLYPLLKNLEDNGLVESRWGDKRPEQRGRARRRFYKITGNGQQVLEQYYQSLNSVREWQPVQS